MIDVDPERFEVMVSEALDGIPGELSELMSNVAVTVQRDGGPAGLLGLYQGVPLTRRSTFYAGALPDRITIYRRAIARCAAATPRSSSRFGGRSFTRWVITSGSAARGCASWVGESAGHIRSQRSARAGLRHIAAEGASTPARRPRLAAEQGQRSPHGTGPASQIVVI